MGSGAPGEYPRGTKCVACKEELGLKALRASGKCYHRDCLRCVACSQQLEDVWFHMVDGKPYCDKCYTENFVKCAECKKPLDGSCAVMLDRNYHHGCPKCAKCRQSLAGDYYFTFENQAYCLECHWQLRIEASRQPKAPASTLSMDPKK